MNNDRIKSFAPVIGDNPVVLVLGTMPSIKSLEKSEYYGYGSNHFWRLMGDFFAFERSDDYNIRKETMKRYGIAIWDVLKSCEREGSLDANIKEEEYNDILGLLKQHPSIKHIILNGKKALSVFEKLTEGQPLEAEVHGFYSTSTASAIRYDVKKEQWQALLGWLSLDAILKYDYRIKPFSDLSNNELYDMIRLRERVFVLEQDCVYVDCDGNDTECDHMVVRECSTCDSTIVGTLRIVPDGVKYDHVSIGRVVVDEAYRGKRVAYIMMQRAITHIYRMQGFVPIVLSAQVVIKSLYEQCGFKVISDVYLEDGIDHVKMYLAPPNQE